MDEQDLIKLPGDNEPQSTINTDNNTAMGNRASYVNVTPSSQSASLNDEREEAYMDPNKIQVTIGDQTTPLVFLFGPKSCGKSMSLIRLARYLSQQGYAIEPDRNFRNSMAYAKRCDEFNEILNTPTAVPGNTLTDFLLAKVYDSHGVAKCQILEAPGEHYFDSENIQVFPPYMHTTFRSCRNRKIWIFMTEPNWQQTIEIKNKYVQRVRLCKEQLVGSSDRCIILYNKVDKVPYLYTLRNPRHIEPALKALNDEYPGMLKIFKNEHLITSAWRKYNFDFVPFTTGYYSETLEGNLTFNPSEDTYPANLWKVILKNLKG